MCCDLSLSLGTVTRKSVVVLFNASIGKIATKLMAGLLISGQWSPIRYDVVLNSRTILFLDFVFYSVSEYMREENSLRFM